MRGQNIFPVHNVRVTRPNTSSNCGCGCGGSGSCGIPRSLNYVSVVRNSTRRRMLNGTFEDLLGNITGAIGTGEPLITTEITVSTEAILKLSALGLGLILAAKNIK